MAVYSAVFSEKKRYAPYCCERNKDIKYAADYRAGSAEEPCDKIEAEYSDKSPVKTADNKQR